MNRTNQILVGLLVIQAGIAAAVTMTRRSPGTTAAEVVFPDFKAEQATRIEILGPRGTAGATESQNKVVLEKQGATWGLPEAEGYPADGTKVKELLDKIAKLESRGAVVTSAKHHGKLEVAADRYQRLVKVTHDGKDASFYLGTSPGAQRVHLRREGGDDVLVVAGLETWSIGDSAATWVDRSYVKVDEGELWSVTVANAKGTFRLERASKEAAWALADLAPGETLDDTTVGDLVRKAATVSLETPLGKGARPEYGLDAPQATVTLETGAAGEDGKPPATLATQSFAIGAKNDANNRYRVKSSTSEYVVEVAEWSLKPFLEKSREDLMKKPEPAPAPEGSAAPGAPPVPGMPPHP